LSRPANQKNSGEIPMAIHPAVTVTLTSNTANANKLKRTLAA
jgi:hypothetical protein